MSAMRMQSVAGKPRDPGCRLQVLPHGFIAKLGFEEVDARGFARSWRMVVAMTIMYGVVNRSRRCHYGPESVCMIDGRRSGLCGNQEGEPRRRSATWLGHLVPSYVAVTAAVGGEKLHGGWIRFAVRHLLRCQELSHNYTAFLRGHNCRRGGTA